MEKETHLPNLHVGIPCQFSGGVLSFELRSGRAVISPIKLLYNHLSNNRGENSTNTTWVKVFGERWKKDNAKKHTLPCRASKHSNPETVQTSTTAYPNNSVESEHTRLETKMNMTIPGLLEHLRMAAYHSILDESYGCFQKQWYPKMDGL